MTFDAFRLKITEKITTLVYYCCFHNKNTWPQVLTGIGSGVGDVLFQLCNGCSVIEAMSGLSQRPLSPGTGSLVKMGHLWPC